MVSRLDMMKYRLKIESSIHEVDDFISGEFNKLHDAVNQAQSYKGRVWIVNSNNVIVATWTGFEWTY